MESCGMSCIKYLLFVFNLLFAISGIGIIVAGALVLADVDDYSHFLENRILAPPVVLIVAGSIIFIIAFLGCFGAIRESYSLLVAFAVCLLIIFIIELAVGIAAAVYKNDFDEALRDSLRSSMKNYNTDNEDKEAWEILQSKLKCCGTDGPSDWNTVQVAVPNSCCKEINNNNSLPNGGCGANFYEIGCLSKLKVKVEDKSVILIGVGIGIAFIQILGIILACLLASTIKKEEGK